MKALTLFAGAGGADYGMAKAGVDHVRCIEYDKHAHATLCAAGFPGVLGDVRDPTLYRDLPPIDLLWASPPCQDWSSAGKREGASGSRNGWPWTWAVIRHLQRRGLGPTWLIAENVTGMLTHSGKDCGKGCCADPTRCPTTYWHEVVMREARALFPWADYRVIDAAAFGTPQFRRRVFLVAGPRPIRWPEPTHGPPTAQASLFGPGLKPYRTVREALGLECVEPNRKPPRDYTDRPAPTIDGHTGVTGDNYEQALRVSFIRTEQRGATATPDTMPAPTVPTVRNQYLHDSDPGVRVLGGGRNPQSAAVAHKRTLRDITDEPSTTIAAQVGGGAGNAGPFVVGMEERNSGQRGFTSTPLDTPSPTVLAGSNRDNGLRLLETRAGTEPDRLDRPAPTVTTTEAKGTRGDNMGRTLKSGGKAGGVDRAADAVWLATGRRRLTVRECAALFDMPENYPWQGTKTSQYKQVGNMVAWRCAKALGDAVFSA